MIFSAPVDFKEALESRAVKALLPTSGSSFDLAQLAPQILERATFSARTTYTEHLAAIDSVINRLLAPETAAPGQSVGAAKARELLRESIRSLGYSAEPGKIGTLQDLASDARLNLIVDMNAGFARGYGQWKQGQNSVVLDQWPAQELVRFESREHPRDWRRRWEAAGGDVSPGGRLVALKNDPIWTDISDFGLPYPPFAYGSGMGVEDVDRGTAVALGLIEPDVQIQPEERGFNDDLQANLPPIDKQSALFQAIRQALGDRVEFVGDTLVFRGAS